MLFNLFHRKSQRSLLIEFNPYQILAAGISRTDEGVTVVNSAAEFDRNDDAGLQAWLGRTFGIQKSPIAAICGLVATQGFLQRETVQPAKLVESDYLTTLVREKYKLENPEEWGLRVVSPLEGTPILPTSAAQPGLVCGTQYREVEQVERRLSEHGLKAVQLEASLLPLFGALFDHVSRHDGRRAAVVISIGEDHTTAYILGKEGVHTPGRVRHGFQSIVQAARKELGLGEEADVRALLHQPTEVMRMIAPKLVRMIGRDLKSLVDSYEMTTGQPAAGIYCAHLPASLAWLAEPLGHAVERPPLVIDCAAWLNHVRIRKEGDVPAFGQHWISALSLVAELPGQATAQETEKVAAGQGPWHLDCRFSTDQPSRRKIGARFVTGTLAVALAAFAVTITVWQLYVSRSLQADTNYWEVEMEKNQKLFDELTRDASNLQERATKLDFAYGLMASSYQVSDFVRNLGTTLPRNMRIDRIELSQGRIALSGDLHEPSEAASGTLNRYLEELRRSPTIGPLFSSIGLTALQRDQTSDSLAFEITFKVKGPQP